MELKLIDGKYSASPVGGLETVRGTQELAQRVVMKLTARRGGFAPLPKYGSRLHLLARCRPSELRLTARQYAMEALADEPGLTLEDVQTRELPDGGIAVKLYFQYEKEKLTVETRVYSNSI